MSNSIDTTGTAETSVRRRQSGRSPSYPAISLPAALERVRILYLRERQFATPVDAIVKHWGYSTLNGPAGLALAALKKYGLVKDEGTKSDRRVQVSDLAVRILDHPNPDKQREAIREAALRPSIHQEMWSTYEDDLPSDSNLIWNLSRERGFTESGAREFVREYRETLAFADLQPDGAFPMSDLSQREGEELGSQFEPSTPDGRPDMIATKYSSDGAVLEQHFIEAKRQTSAAGRIQTYTVPVGVGENVIVQGEFPLTAAKWGQFIAVLTAMKPGLVAEERADVTVEGGAS